MFKRHLEMRIEGKQLMRRFEPQKKIETWDIVELPKGNETVGCKWIFIIKYKADGRIKRYKTRLVAKSFTQTYSFDYQETFATVAKMNTTHILLFLVANLD